MEHAAPAVTTFAVYKIALACVRRRQPSESHRSASRTCPSPPMQAQKRSRPTLRSILSPLTAGWTIYATRSGAARGRRWTRRRESRGSSRTKCRPARARGSRRRRRRWRSTARDRLRSPPSTAARLFSAPRPTRARRSRASTPAPPYSIAAHRELDEEAQERVDEVQSKLRELQEDASLAQEGAAARRRGSGRKKVEDVDAAAVAIQRTLRGRRGRARARASKG